MSFDKVYAPVHGRPLKNKNEKHKRRLKLKMWQESYHQA